MKIANDPIACALSGSFNTVLNALRLDLLVKMYNQLFQSADAFSAGLPVRLQA
jgi:hypothetical protein